ncbi:thiamine phosphate synthase [Seohaeicola saemankumensis]|uniref:thiamine phosphate synthase n=1 Tax=Seohaeicola saemankumensis TaxID=481181 RepID=UPI001E3F532D|nr:thiamine phosphate synthase [Seohaeicola saemankumensis]MCD1626830.1 thiamine phosphate synthase [Seohaeicola saemankumensis]
MADTPDAPQTPQLYLISPATFDLQVFPDLLARVLDAQPVGCVRLGLASKDEDNIARAADALREVTHARDVALVIENHILMVERLGLDGVHLTDGARSVRKTRKDLGADAIVGAFCGIQRHEGMSAGEAGADYISFGPVGQTPLGDGTQVDMDVFAWWSEIIEVPVVAEGALTEDLIRTLAPITDFIALGEEIWTAQDPVAELARLTSAMQL